MERRTDQELREHPVFRELVLDLMTLPQKRQERLAEDLEWEPDRQIPEQPNFFYSHYEHSEQEGIEEV